MTEAADMILPMLREMREETRRGFDEVREEMRHGFEEMRERLDRIEKRQDTHRDLIAAESILGRYAAKEVEERLTALERKVESLEARK
jgi:polyhydroxyalkanoate synthesis regulator phasin